MKRLGAGWGCGGLSERHPTFPVEPLHIQLSGVKVPVTQGERRSSHHRAARRGGHCPPPPPCLCHPGSRGRPSLTLQSAPHGRPPPRDTAALSPESPCSPKLYCLLAFLPPSGWSLLVFPPLPASWCWCAIMGFSSSFLATCSLSG